MRTCLWTLIALLLAIQATAQEKIALVIGNGAYAPPAAIDTIGTEVSTVADSLTRLGFDVHFHKDLAGEDMRRTIAGFSNALDGADVALFYYAGHGIQLAGRNYLIPTDAVLSDETSVALSTIPVDVVLAQLERFARTRIVFLDTCRDNPMQDTLARSLGPARAAEVLGDCLAPIDTKAGTFVGFAKGIGSLVPDAPPAPQVGACAVCPATVLVPGGETVMGSATGTAAERPTVPQVIAPFRMAVTEVTVGQIRTFEDDTGRPIPKGCYVWTADGKLRNRSDAHWDAPGVAVDDNAPAACLSWDDARAYVVWLNQKDPSGGWRLPSEAEYEYAARAGTISDYPWDGGRDSVCTQANGADASSRFRWRNTACDDGVPDIAAASAFPANAFGLRNMIGNLWEWTADCFNASHAGAFTDGRARTNGTCDSRVLRGGSWDDPIENLRAPYRVGIPKTRRQANVGFRPVQDLP